MKPRRPFATPRSRRRTGVDGAPAARSAAANDPKAEGKEIVARRHPDWSEHEMMWRRQMDSLEGGDRFRNAVYGYDRMGLPVRMLLRHDREYPDPLKNPQQYGGGYPGAPNVLIGEGGELGMSVGPMPGMIGADPGATAQDDVYEMRRARTPVPEWVGDACGTHLAKIYDQEVNRDPETCPAELLEWWKDVDGAGTTIDDYMRETVAPLLGALGTLDILIDHPPAPPGVKIETGADVLKWGLDQVVASYILPMNVVWWSEDNAGRYIEVLVREYVDPSKRMDHDDDGNAIDPNATGRADKNGKAQKWREEYVRFRLWRADESILYNFVGDTVIDRFPHNYGRVPIIRLVAQKKHRSKMVGKSWYEAVAALARAFYNAHSEAILSSVLQATPLLCIPEKYLKADNTLSVGAEYTLPMAFDPDNGTYTAPCYVSPNKDPHESLRSDMEDLRAAADRAACLAKPPGAERAGTIAQSGLSKSIDAQSGHKLLKAIAQSLCKAETFIAELALIVIRANGRDLTPEETASIRIGYPSSFELADTATLLANAIQLQLVAASCGNVPMTEQAILSLAIRQILLGLDDDEYQAMDDEIELLVASKSLLREQIHELKAAAVTDASSQRGKGGMNEDDPSGQSGGTSLGQTVAVVD